MAGSCSDGSAAGAAPPGKVFKHEPLAMLCYFMLGCGFLAGWNAFLTATDFFNSVFPDRSVDRVFTIVYLPLTFTLVGLVARFPRLFWTARIRMWTAFSLFTQANAAIPVIDACLIRGKPPAGSSSQAAYGLTLAAVALVAVGDGLSQGTVLGDAALLPAKYTRAVVMGMSASGCVIGVLRLSTKAALAGAASGGLRISTQIYFACAASITACCLMLYHFVMPRLDVIAYYRSKLAAEQAEGVALSLGKDTAAGDAPSINPTATGHWQPSSGGACSSSPDSCRTLSPSTATSQHCAGVSGLDVESLKPAGCEAAVRALHMDAGTGTPRWSAILRLNWRLCLAVFAVYVVTLSIFPGFLAENVHSEALGSWYGVLLIFSFNVLDFAGRCMPWMGCRPSQTTLLLMALARLILVPLFAVFSRMHSGPAFSEPLFFVLTSILGGSNGWLTGLIFTAAPLGLSPAAAELAGNINVFCELAGLNVGAFCGWLWTV